MVDKLVVDDRGRVLSYTKTAAGDEIYSYENEVFPIVDSFVREHPDFSFQGARGTLCLTGFQGIFGYRTQTGAPEGTDREAEKEGALQVVAALKEEGWNFASHGYGHYHMDQIEYSKVEYDTASWQAEVASLVGPTKVMVWPYGGHVRSGKIHELLYDTGFRIFCGVGAKPYLAREPDGLGIFQDRKALDGYSLRNRREMYLYLFDTEEVWDPLRPKDVSL
ncbi:MAG: polysaccharide deacetylase family protein [Bianqueaceae bacterium]